jgi:hypothetical protein
MLYEEYGGGGLFEHSEFQRYWRDVNRRLPRPYLGLGRRRLDENRARSAHAAGLYLHPRVANA